MSGAAGTPNPADPWPSVPALPPDKLADAQLELYKSQLAAHSAAITKELDERFAAAEHVRKLAELQAQAAIDQQKAATLAQTERETAAALAGVNAASATEAAELSLTTLDRNFLNASVMEFHKAYLEVAKGTIDRWQKRAELLQAAAVAIGALYTGLFAWFFITAEKATRPDGTVTGILPVRGIIPTVFLGLTIALAMAFIAFRTAPKDGANYTNMGNNLQFLEQQRNLFVSWTAETPQWRLALIQAAVICLGLSVATLPLPFVDIGNPTAFWIAGIAAGATALYAIRVAKTSRP